MTEGTFMNEPALRVPAPSFSPRFTATTTLERRLSATLWSWRGASWSGFIDFREPGIFMTHWGYGEWRLEGTTDRVVVLRNGYDPFHFELTFDDDLLSFRCTRTNHSDRPVGDLLFDYANQALPAPFWR
jgi:hypothetical protein